MLRPGMVGHIPLPGSSPVTMKTALVTGASAGLGRELVRQLVRDKGMIVLATARGWTGSRHWPPSSRPGRVVVEAGDLADPEFRDRLWMRSEEVFPDGLDLLVNNAGLGDYVEFADQSAESMRRIIEVNLMALMDLTQKAIRRMRPRGSGQVLQVSSVLGFVGLPYSAVYVASKHAVNGLVKSLRYECGGRASGSGPRARVEPRASSRRWRSGPRRRHRRRFPGGSRRTGSCARSCTDSAAVPGSSSRVRRPGRSPGWRTGSGPVRLGDGPVVAPLVRRRDRAGTERLEISIGQRNGVGSGQSRVGWGRLGPDQEPVERIRRSAPSPFRQSPGP